MNSELYENIIEYISRPHPEGLAVADFSIPVLFFGNIETSTVATVGINPSSSEFLDENGRPRRVDEKRFVDRESLGVDNASRLTIEQAELVYQSKIKYFLPTGNPYRKWFDVLDRHLRSFDVSYYENSLVHFDITPWATKEIWKNLSINEKKIALDEGCEIFKKILTNSKADIIFLNGRQVIDCFEYNIKKLDHCCFIENNNKTYEIKKISIDNKDIYAWSVNLQSSFGVSCELKGLILDTVLDYI